MKPTTLLLFTRQHTAGLLAGIKTHDAIRHVDRWHAAQWVKGIRRNSRRGVLEYKLVVIEARDERLGGKP